MNVQVIHVKIQEYVMTTLTGTRVPVRQDLQELIVKQVILFKLRSFTKQQEI